MRGSVGTATVSGVGRDRLTRRGFLRVTAQGTAALALVGVSGRLLSGVRPGALREPGRQRAAPARRLPSRIIATTGEVVAGHDLHLAHRARRRRLLPAGRRRLVLREQLRVGPRRRRLRALRERRQRSSAPGRASPARSSTAPAGPTPWGTWLSCEEYPGARSGSATRSAPRSAVARPAMGRFQHEAAAADPANRCIYLTEDRTDGGLYRFVPTTWGDLSAGTLQVLTRGRPACSRGRPSPTPSATVTADQGPGARHGALQRRRGRRHEQGHADLHDQGRQPGLALRPGRRTRWRSSTTAPCRSTACCPASTTSRCRRRASSTSPRTATTCRSCSCATTVDLPGRAGDRDRRARRSPDRPSTRPAPASTSARSANPAAPTRSRGNWSMFTQPGVACGLQNLTGRQVRSPTAWISASTSRTRPSATRRGPGWTSSSPGSSPASAAGAVPATSTPCSRSGPPGSDGSARPGWIGVGWPTEHGGRGLSLPQQVIWFEEYARAEGPGRVGIVGEGLAGPTIVAFGDADQQARFLPADPRRHRAVVPGLLRAERRVRPGQRRRPGPSSTATSGSSAARRSGRRWPRGPSGAS